jgi:hypothetical protein
LDLLDLGLLLGLLGPGSALGGLGAGSGRRRVRLRLFFCPSISCWTGSLFAVTHFAGPSPWMPPLPAHFTLRQDWAGLALPGVGGGRGGRGVGACWGRGRRAPG